MDALSATKKITKYNLHNTETDRVSLGQSILIYWHWLAY